MQVLFKGLVDLSKLLIKNLLPHKHDFCKKRSYMKKESGKEETRKAQTAWQQSEDYRSQCHTYCFKDLDLGQIVDPLQSEYSPKLIQIQVKDYGHKNLRVAIRG